VRTVLISHFHADHVAALCDFPRARFRCFASAYDTVKQRSRFHGLRTGFLPALLPPDFEHRLDVVDRMATRPLPHDCLPFTHGIDLLGDGSVLAVTLDGHATGQMGLFVHASDGRRYFFVADACWVRESYERQVVPHAITRLLFDDTPEYAHTLARIHALHRGSPETRIVPSHCERTLEALVDEECKT
jgi:glyoxylase-like metal-dependent hydrolase (beta-lactamase superfamily II)